MSVPEPGDKNSLQQYLEKLLAEEAKKSQEQEKTPGEQPAPAEGAQASAAKAIPDTTPTPEPPKPAPPKLESKEPPPKSPEWDALGSLLSQALGEAKEAPSPSAPSAPSRAAAAPTPASAAPPRPAQAPPQPPAQPALEEVRREAERLLAQALKEADELRRQAVTEAEAIRALARAEREAARREKAEAMAKLAELDSRLHAAIGSPQPAAPQQTLPESSPAPPTPAVKPPPPIPAVPPPAVVGPSGLGPPTPQAPAKASKRPWSSLFKWGEAKKAVPVGKPAAASSATPAPPGTAANPTETYQGEVQVKITAPVDWPRLHRLEQALSSKSGLALRGTRSTAEGTFMRLKLSQPMSLIQALMETEVVIAVLPGGHDKTGMRRLEVTLGEAPLALPPVDTPERQVNIPLAPATPPRARGHQGRAYLTVAPLPSLQELGRFQGLLQGIPGVSIVATAAATDRRGAVFTLELKDVPLGARLEEAIPHSRFQEEAPNRFLLALPQAW